MKFVCSLLMIVALIFTSGAVEAECVTAFNEGTSTVQLTDGTDDLLGQESVRIYVGGSGVAQCYVEDPQNSSGPRRVEGFTVSENTGPAVYVNPSDVDTTPRSRIFCAPAGIHDGGTLCWDLFSAP